LSVTTISGKTQDLILNVDDGDPNVLILEDDEVLAKQNFSEQKFSDEETNAQNSDFETSVVEAMKSLIVGENLQALELEIKPERFATGFKIEFVESYHIGEFVGCKYKISTEISARFDLNESLFAKEGDVALSFSSLKIAKNEPTFLYVLQRFESRR
jgi:hypothetical protein